MDNSDIKKDNINTILAVVIILLIIAIFLPPLFRYIYSDKKEETNNNIQQLTCRKEEPVAIDQRGTKIAIVIESEYENDVLNTLSISFDYPENIRDDEIATSLIVEDERRKVDSFANQIGIQPTKNGTRLVYTFDLKTKPELMQNELIKKYGSSETYAKQKEYLISDGFTCNK